MSAQRSTSSNRGLTAETVERFGIGYAPNSWNDVLKPIRRQRDGAPGSSPSSASSSSATAARCAKASGTTIASAIGVMFPIRDARGRTIAFGGRIIDQGEPKYLNSPETALFHKGRELYGLYETRQARITLKRLVIVEGYMDTVRLHQSGIQYAVATLGTATTPEHLKRIFRLVSEVVFAFDGDRAGRAAAWRALQHALPEAREGREMRFLFLPEGQDPDTLVGEEGREAFEARLEPARAAVGVFRARAVGSQVGPLARRRTRAFRRGRPAAARASFRPAFIASSCSPAWRRPSSCTASRLDELWSAGAQPAAIGRGETAVLSARAAPARQQARTHNSAGRGSLVRQAVGPAAALPGHRSDRAATKSASRWIDCRRAGHRRCCGSCWTTCAPSRRSPPAQVIERWADRPEQEFLVKLLQREDVIADGLGGSWGVAGRAGEAGRAGRYAAVRSAEREGQPRAARRP